MAATLTGLPCLRHLRLAFCGLTGDGLRALAEGSESVRRGVLRHLDVSGAAFVLAADMAVLHQALAEKLQVRGSAGRQAAAGWLACLLTHHRV